MLVTGSLSLGLDGDDTTQGKDLQGLKPRSGTAPIMGLAESTKTEQRKTGLRLQDLFSLGVLYKI